MDPPPPSTYTFTSKEIQHVGGGNENYLTSKYEEHEQSFSPSLSLTPHMTIPNTGNSDILTLMFIEESCLRDKQHRKRTTINSWFRFRCLFTWLIIEHISEPVASIPAAPTSIPLSSQPGCSYKCSCECLICQRGYSSCTCCSNHCDFYACSCPFYNSYAHTKSSYFASWCIISNVSKIPSQMARLLDDD